MFTYEYINKPKRRAFKEKISQEQNKLFMSAGALWINMVSKYFNIPPEEVVYSNFAIVARKLWIRENKKWEYNDFKELFKYFLESKIPEDSKMSFDLCMSEKYVAKYKIYKRNKKEQKSLAFYNEL